jgi:hypothetical protein
VPTAYFSWLFCSQNPYKSIPRLLGSIEFFSGCPNQEVDKIFILKGHKIGTCSYFGADSAAKKRRYFGAESPILVRRSIINLISTWYRNTLSTIEDLSPHFGLPLKQNCPHCPPSYQCCAVIPSAVRHLLPEDDGVRINNICYGGKPQ